MYLEIIKLMQFDVTVFFGQFLISNSCVHVT